MAKILYIAGAGRSGTTLLGNLLGERDHFVSSGELHYLWQRGLVENRACGCGSSLRACDTWKDVFVRSFGGIDVVDPTLVVRSQGEIHTRHALRALRYRRTGRTLEKFEYSRFLSKLYAGIAAAHGASVVVDSSKFPTDAIVASGLPDHEVYVLHVVRDPRAVAFSWARKKPVPDKTTNRGLLPQIGLVRSTVVWSAYNVIIATAVRRAVGASRYRLVRYEDLVSRPQETLDEIAGFVSEPAATDGVIEDGRVELSIAHTASGNPMRFGSGIVQLRLDDEWRHEMSVWKKAGIAALASPMLGVSGYSFGAGAR